MDKLAQAVIDGEPEDAEELAQQALDQGLDPLECINKGLSPASTASASCLPPANTICPT